MRACASSCSKGVAAAATVRATPFRKSRRETSWPMRKLPRRRIHPRREVRIDREHHACADNCMAAAVIVRE